MQLTQDTTILRLIKDYPFLIEALAERNPVFEKLHNPVLRNTIGRVATIEKAAHMGKEEPLDLLLFIAGRIMAATGEQVAIVPPDAGKNSASRPALSDEKRLDGLKAIIRELHDGTDLKVLQDKFAQTVGDISPKEIARLEQTLVNEGLEETEIKKLCNLHVELFQTSLDAQDPPVMPAGHPVHTYMEENEKISDLTEVLNQELQRLGQDPSDTLWSFTVNHLRTLVTELTEVKMHYTRKENQLFPLLEKHGIEAPAQVMWEVHDDIREQLRKSTELLKEQDREAAIKSLVALAEAINDMIYKEERILFPMAIETFTAQDWAIIRHGDNEIGYCFGVTPGTEWEPVPLQNENGHALTGLVDLDTGKLSQEVINTMLCNLPVDMSLVDPDGKVAYYSDSRHRIFPRSPAVIGRDVKNCHPPKSVHMVTEILEKLKSGERDKAEFWLELGGTFIHIQYIALRNEAGTYLGCLEVGQDATHVRSLTGQRRLLEWE